MKLMEAKKVLMLGIGGQGMRGRATILAAKGKQIVGADQNIEALRSAPDLSGFELISEQDAIAVASAPETDAVVYSDALPKDHAALTAARQASKLVLNLFDATGQIAEGYTTIAVAGTHGKSTTAAFLTHILVAAGKKPSALIGAPMPEWENSNALVGESDLLVVEADEYLDHYLSLKPKYAIVTNIDHDHPDYFKTLDDVASSFSKFISLVDPSGVIVAPAELVSTFETNIKWPTQTQSVSYPKPQLQMPLAGAHMQRNAWLAITLAGHLGVSTAEAQASLANFNGIGRRMEKIGDWQGLEIYTDYAHHPAEISVTLMAAVERFAGKRILAIIEPHTEERFDVFFNDYLAALQHAPVGLLIAPIYRARQDGPILRRANELAAKLAEKRDRVWSINTLDQTEVSISGLREEFDIVIGMSAGSLDEELRKIVQ